MELQWNRALRSVTSINRFLSGLRFSRLQLGNSYGALHNTTHDSDGLRIPMMILVSNLRKMLF